MSLIGTTLAHYTITGRLGAGGMGEVWRATDTKLGREVAIKVLPPRFAEDPDRLIRFKREARVLASLNHPNVAAIHGFEEIEGHRFLVLEYVEGVELGDRIAGKRLPVAQAVALARQIAEGVESAHEKGIVHRDLKPANVKLTANGTAKVLDFGLAYVCDEKVAAENLHSSPTIAAEQTVQGALLGTAPYMSPEQTRGQAVDARTDVWALGCVIYQMLTGSEPFRGGTSTEVFAAILEREPDWSALPADVPPRLRLLLRRCLAKDPRQRLHAIADVRIGLQDALEETSGAATGVPVRRGWMTLSIVAAFAVGALAWHLLTPPREAETPGRHTPARLMIPVLDETPVLPLPSASSLAVSPDGEYLVFVARAVGGRARPGIEYTEQDTQLYMRLINRFEITPIDGTEGGSAPFISPDSQWIGFVDENGRLKKVARGGGAPVEICNLESRLFRGASWSADGQIYFAESSTGIQVVPAGGGTPRTVAAPNHEAGEKTLRFPQVLPGGRSLLLTLASTEILSYDDASIALLSLDSGETRVLLEGGTNPRYVPTGHIVFGRAGRVLAVPFDLEGMQVTGPPTEVLDGVVTSDGYGSAHFSFSDDGTLVYIAGGPEQFAFELFVLHPDGRIEPIPQPPRPYGDARVSPDGERLVVSVLGANASLWIYEFRRGTMTRLVGSWDNYSAVWSLDGDRIAFSSNRGDGHESIWLMAADGSGGPVRLDGGARFENATAWSPDGRWIVANQTSVGGGTDVALLASDGSGTTTPVVSTPAQEFNGTFSPNGRFIAYNSNESGQTEVYVGSFPITGQRWKLSEEGGDTPRWSPDGKRIFYLSHLKLMVVDVDTAPQFKPSRARELLHLSIADVRNFDVFPDGARFVLVGRRTTQAHDQSPIIRYSGDFSRVFPSIHSDLRVVTDWFVELARGGER